MPRNDSLESGELTDTSYYILLTLIKAQHGYLIMKSIEEMTNNRFSVGPASLYTTIKKLVSAGLIEQLDSEEENRKTYMTTDKGMLLLKKDVERRKEMVKHAEKIFNEMGEIME
ncbi:PadR family transcriptional regulator [Cytobacillus sp. FJAT-54145]|uniref:PadR family transcriptional regulator n=1 Tax=Cytobacillus spartinae TaxID=3299023 RepID=A0ABW6K7D6_9BACI